MLGCSAAQTQPALQLLAAPQHKKLCASTMRTHLKIPKLSVSVCCSLMYQFQVSVQEGALIAKAAVTSGSLSALGDILAQLLVKTQLKESHDIDKQFELERTARMFSFGLVLYGVHPTCPTPRYHGASRIHMIVTGTFAGPFQHFWYRALSNWFPGTGLRSFGIKVGLNQLVLGPLVLCTAFAWNLGLQQQADKIPGKISKDMFPTLVNGWKFWVPAASLNFFFVPLQHQVLWMSLCGVLWTGYISFASYNSANAITVR